MEASHAGRRRSLEISAEILRAASSGTSKTRIMYSARLNHKQLKRYLEELIVSGLLRQDHAGAVFTPTEKGKGFLACYGEVERLRAELAQRQREIDTIFLPEGHETATDERAWTGTHEAAGLSD